MSDLDFDELDKAVSTLMGDVPKVEPPKADDVKTLNISSTLPDESRPSLAKLDSALAEVNKSTTTVDEKPTPVAISPAPSLATRRGGRFMDVVHPSSDMKGVAKPVASTSRQGVTIEPAGVVSFDKSVDVAMVKEANDVAIANTNKPAATNEAATHNEQAIPKNDWPDPLDMTAYNAEPDTGGVATAVESDTSAASLAGADMDNDTDMQPLVSPFLPDAKVEKRPLGGAPTEEVKEDEQGPVEEPGRTPVQGSLGDDDIAADHAVEQLPADPRTVEQPLPPELQSDLMAIETDGGTSADILEKSDEDVKVAVDDTPVEKAQDAPVAASTDKKSLSESTAPTATATLTGPTSIPQQYHEEPTTSDQTNGAIYDTDSYHQPLAHPAKTKSGWLWIIWILLLLMVGGGGAVALYFLGVI